MEYDAEFTDAVTGKVWGVSHKTSSRDLFVRLYKDWFPGKSDENIIVAEFVTEVEDSYRAPDTLIWGGKIWDLVRHTNFDNSEGVDHRNHGALREYLLNNSVHNADEGTVKQLTEYTAQLH